jgi:hypothetical protein
MVHNFSNSNYFDVVLFWLSCIRLEYLDLVGFIYFYFVLAFYFFVWDSVLIIWILLYKIGINNYYWVGVELYIFGMIITELNGNTLFGSISLKFQGVILFLIHFFQCYTPLVWNQINPQVRLFIIFT